MDVKTSIVRREWAIPYGFFLMLVFFEAMDSNAFGPIIAQIRDEFGLSATQVGLYTGLASFFGLVVTVPVGELIRRRGYRLAGGSISVVIVIGAMVSFIASSFPVLLIGRCLAMCGTRGCLLIGQAGGMTVAPKAIRNTTWAILISMLSLGGSFGAYFLGGIVGGTYGWRAVMLAIAGSAVFVALVYTLLLRMPAASTDDNAPPVVTETLPIPDQPVPEKPANVYRTWPLYGLGLAYALATAGMTINTTFASVVVKDNWGLDAQFTGTALGLGQLISLPFMIFAGVLADRFSARKLVMTIFILLTGTGAFVQFASLELGAADGGPTLFMVGLILCFVGKAGGGLLYAYVPDYVKSGTSLGSAFAVLSIVSMSGYVIEPILAGVLRDATQGWHMVFITFGLAPLLALLVIRGLKLR